MTTHLAHLPLCVGVMVVIFVSCLQASESYPKFEAPQWPPAQAGVEVDFGTEIADPIMAVLKRRLGARYNQPDLLTAEDVSTIIEVLKDLETRIPARTWPFVKPKGRIPLPNVFATGDGLCSGVDASYNLSFLTQDKSSLINLWQYALGWEFFLQANPNPALEWLYRESRDRVPTSTDVVRLHATLGYWQGEKLHGILSKETWQKLHRSPNPIHRFIALEKFDSVEQSPAEFLALYRECLFGACSYLEVRALEAITGNKDFREDVAKMLEEYIASKPLADDGTLPSLRNNFRDLVAGAKQFITGIRHPETLTAPVPPQPDPFVPKTPGPTAAPATRASVPAKE